MPVHLSETPRLAMPEEPPEQSSSTGVAQGSRSESPDQHVFVPSNEIHGIFSESPEGSVLSLAEMLGYEPSLLDQNRINSALSGKSVEHPEKVNAGFLLSAKLAESPNIEDSDSETRANPGESSQKRRSSTSNISGKGTALARRTSSFIGKGLRNTTSRLRGGRQQTLTEAEKDAINRRRVIADRQRIEIGNQSDSDEAEKLWNSLGINRKKKDGTWE
jgi:hypothetical protein